MLITLVKSLLQRFRKQINVRVTLICISKGGCMWVGVTSLTFNQGIRGTFSANGPSITQLLGFLIHVYTPMHHLPLALIRISNFEKNLAKLTLINILTCWRSLKMSKQIPNPHQKGFWFWLCIWTLITWTES